jgi:ABC-type branched-subunit amino acid transport system substrate-binding protein
MYIRKEKKLLGIGGRIFSILLLSLLFFFMTWGVSIPEQPIKIFKVGAAVNFGDRMGIQVKRCFELLTEQLNASGGLIVKGERYHVDMIVYDHKYQADAGRAAFERLVFQDKVQTIFSYGSAPTLAGIEVTEPNKIPLFHAAIGSQLMSPKYKYAFHTNRTTPVLLGAASFMKKHLITPKLKTVVVVANDDITGRDTSKEVVAMWKYCNIKVLDTLYHKRGTVDLNPVAVKIKSINPDIVDFDGILAGAEALRLVKAIYQSGWKGQIIGDLITPTVPDIVNACGKESVEGMFGQIFDPAEIPNPPPLAIPFRKAYTEKYGVWEIDGLRWFDGWHYFVEAVKKANSLSADDIAEAMQGLSVETVAGESRMCRRPDLGNNRYVDSSLVKFWGQVRNGRVVYVDRIPAIEGIRVAQEVYGGEWK